MHGELFQTKFTLPRARRSPPPVQALANRCLGVPFDERALSEGIRSGALGAVRSVGSVADKLGAEVDRLLSDGLQLRDIAIVSLRGRDAVDSVHRLERVGRLLEPPQVEEGGEQAHLERRGTQVQRRERG